MHEPYRLRIHSFCLEVKVSASDSAQGGVRESTTCDGNRRKVFLVVPGRTPPGTFVGECVSRIIFVYLQVSPD